MWGLVVAAVIVVVACIFSLIVFLSFSFSSSFSLFWIFAVFCLTNNAPKWSFRREIISIMDHHLDCFVSVMIKVWRPIFHSKPWISPERNSSHFAQLFDRFPAFGVSIANEGIHSGYFLGIIIPAACDVSCWFFDIFLPEIPRINVHQICVRRFAMGFITPIEIFIQPFTETYSIERHFGACCFCLQTFHWLCRSYISFRHSTRFECLRLIQRICFLWKEKQQQNFIHKIKSIIFFASIIFNSN